MTIKLKNIIKDFWISSNTKEILEICFFPSVVM